MLIKLVKNWVDAEDNVHVKGTTLDVDADTGKELIDAEKAEEAKAEVKEVKEVDMKVEVKEAVAEALKEIKAEKAEEVEVKEVAVEEELVVVKDAPLWKDAPEFLDAVIKAGRGQVDERLYKSPAGQGETTAADGGYLVEHRISQDIYKMAAQESVLLPKCDQLEIGPNANGLKINQVNESSRSATTLFGGVRVYSPAEGAAKTAFKQAYSQVDISLGKLCAVNYVTDELLQDRTALAGMIRKDVGSALAWVIDDDIINGTTNTDMIEIENHAATVQFTVAGDNPTAAELMGMYASMAPQSVNRAEWFMSLAQYVAIGQLESTSGVKIVQPSYEVSAYGTLFGRPINVIEQAGAAADDTSIMFLDLSQYLVIKKGGVDEAQSIHVKFLEDETAFRWTMRMGGSPKVASAITLPSGDVVSPFVTRD